MIGTRINERYDVDKRVGKGAFGEVFRASDCNLKRTVAIKVLTDPGYEGGFRERFQREAEAMANMMHPHIATVFDFGEFDERPYLVMEYVDGGALSQYCDNMRDDLARSLRIAGQICQAMAYAHKCGVVHRDLTLRNILIDHDGNARVLDFGLAKLMNAAVQSDPTVVVGTPHYMAPEQASGGGVDNRADVFSFGVCLYRIFAGRYPFESEHPASLLYLIGNEDPAPLPREIPSDLQNIVLKCLEKQPEHRYQSFGDLGDEIESIRKRYSESEIPLVGAGDVDAGRSSRRNPYLNRVMIKNPDDFFGRKREVKRIYSRLDAPRPQSISIVGERRVGKSSLLNYLYQRRIRRINMENYHDTVFIYMDFQRAQEIDMAKFIDILFNMFNYELGEEISAVTGERTLDALSQVIEKMNGQGKRVVMLLDEFEAITANPKFDMQFFSFLRFLANNFKVAYVTSSYSDLQDLCYDKDIADSPFFNIFSNLPLRPFSRDETLELIRVPSERESVPLDTYSDRILKLSGNFPFFIQVACSNVFELILETDGEPDWNEVVRLFEDEARPHYAFIWERMDDAAKEILSRIASQRSVDRKLRHVSEDLQRRGYINENGADAALFSEPFARFVRLQSGGGKSGRSFFGNLFGKR